MGDKAIVDDIQDFTVGSSLIYDERMRQCAKGFGRDHDDTHKDESILYAAQLIVATVCDPDMKVPEKVPSDLADLQWVFDLGRHVAEKYRDAPIRRLVIAGAMIVAEIERRQRLATQ